MKTEYKSYGLLFYAYNPKTDITVRVSANAEPEDFQVFGFKMDDWEYIYKRLSAAEFNKALNETIKKIKKIAK